MILTLKEWLARNDLMLSHPGHGHNDGDMPVGPEELKRLSAEVRVVAEDGEAPHKGHRYTRGID